MTAKLTGSKDDSEENGGDERTAKMTEVTTSKMDRW